MAHCSSQNLLSACHGARRVTIGCETPEALRLLSDARSLTCPGCGEAVVLHAGTVRAHHFAHLPGAVCRFPQTEPETEEHRTGKLLIAQWLRTQFPDGEITVEAFLPTSRQRADILLDVRSAEGVSRRVAVEFQCANLSAREWRRRRGLYRAQDIADLWLLGGTRLRTLPVKNGNRPAPKTVRATASHILRTTELERAMLSDRAPLLFLDCSPAVPGTASVTRFRPVEEECAPEVFGRLSVRPLAELAFPWPLLERTLSGNAVVTNVHEHHDAKMSDSGQHPSGDQLLAWLQQRYHVTLQSLSPLFGAPIAGQDIVLCDPRIWQAAVYYRFIHNSVAGNWWLVKVETWARAYLPLAQPLSIPKLRALLRGLQDYYGAAGLLSLPVGSSRSNARVAADLETLANLPAREEVLRLARYRRTLQCE